jgi:dipeptidyl aminopeptidase/acylaminoacyl peptidase
MPDSLELIPRQVLFGNPERANPQIAPDGKKMSYLAAVNNVLNVWVGTVGKEDFRAITKDTERGISHYFWSEDSKHIFYLQDVKGNENWHVYDVNLASNEIRDLTPFENVQAQIIDHNRHFPDELLIAMNKEDVQLHDVYHLHIPTGELRQVAKNPGNVARWVTDANLKVRGCLAATPDGGFDLLLRDEEGSEWQKYLSWNSQDSLNSGPICFTKDGGSLILKDSRNANAAKLVKLHLSSGSTEVLAEDPQFDVSDLIIHPDTYEVQAVGFVKARDEWRILDESIRDDVATISQLHHGDFFLVNRDHADQKWLVGFTADNGPVPYYVYDRKEKSAQFLFHHRPELNRYTLATMEPVSFPSRDGLTIHGYLTLPPNGPQTNLPMVLNVHGGPWHRDVCGFNPEVQWFANRGYACLQVNFRGSTGYGKEFINAGDKEWGGKMQNDLTDAVQWAISRGTADLNRIAIYGGSYGGYAALAGATFTPDLFHCAVAIVGPSNLITFIRSIPPYWSTFLAVLHQRVGNPDVEEDFLISRSPLFKVDQIKIPMLIAQGANDPRVKQAESEQIVEAMRRKGIDHLYLLFPDEGHGFAKPENRLKFYAAAEKFLAKHLGGRSEPAEESTDTSRIVADSVGPHI